MGPESDNNDWKYYAIRFGFGIVAILLPITLGLAALTYSNLKTDTKDSFTKLELLVEAKAVQQQTLLYKQADKLDEVCRKVDAHEFMLRLPFSQRQEIYRLPKYEKGGDK